MPSSLMLVVRAYSPTTVIDPGTRTHSAASHAARTSHGRLVTITEKQLFGRHKVLIEICRSELHDSKLNQQQQPLQPTHAIATGYPSGTESVLESELLASARYCHAEPYGPARLGSTEEFRGCGSRRRQPLASPLCEPGGSTNTKATSLRPSLLSWGVEGNNLTICL